MGEFRDLRQKLNWTYHQIEIGRTESRRAARKNVFSNCAC